MIGTQTQHVIPGGVFLRDRIENRLLPGELILLLLRQFVDAVQNVLLLAQFLVEDRRQPFDALRVLRRGRGILGDLLGQFRQVRTWSVASCCCKSCTSFVSCSGVFAVDWASTAAGTSKARQHVAMIRYTISGTPE